MEKQKNISEILELVPQPGFCVKDNRITLVNQAAQALLLSPGQEIAPLLHTGSEEYQQFHSGHLYLSLDLGGQIQNAAITRLEDMDLFLLHPDSYPEEFRSMGLISMELRGPLMNVMSNAQQLMNQLGPDHSDTAAKMNKGLLQLMRLVCNLSDVSRYYEYSHMETRDICAFLEELLEKAEALISSSGVHLSWELPKEAIPCLIDPEQIERAVWNLISNAVKFLPRDGSLHIKLVRHGHRLHLTATDSGSGIAEQVRSTVFQHYLRQPGIEDYRYGLGLGLAIIRTAAVNHGGTVMISSGKNGGTSITMTLAICQNQDAVFCSPVFRPDYTGGWDHALLELSDCLPAELYREL